MNYPSPDYRIQYERVEDWYSSFVFPAVTGDAATIARMYERGVLGNGQEVCRIAAANGQLEVLRLLHEGGCDVTTIADELLMLAAENGRLEIVRYLHALGYGLLANGDSAISAAAAKARLPVLQYLHENGTSLESCADTGRLLVLEPKKKPVVEYLARHGVNPWGPQVMALLRSIRHGTLQEVRENFSGPGTVICSDLLLAPAAERGDVDIISFLHQSGCSLRVHDDLSLRIAADHGHLQVLEYLHSNGCDIHAHEDESLKVAAEGGHVEATRMLIERGVDLAAIDSATLDLVRMGGHSRVLAYLSECSSDAISEHRADIQAMQDELYQARAVYRPSKLWEFFNAVNMKQLQRDGLHGFKRSINQNYFNFVPHTLRDPQILTLGRWWLSHISATPFRLKLTDPDLDPESGELRQTDRRVFAAARRHPIFERAGRRLQLLLYRSLVGMLWDYVCAHDRLGLVEHLAEPRLGSPVEIHLGRKLVSQDLAHSILECNSIFGELPAGWRERSWRIAEVGAGYGRLAHVILKAVHCQYVVFDIPPSLYVSQWYLSELFPDKKIFRFRHFEKFENIAHELVSADIAFFTANQIELMPDSYFDLTINISSLHELKPEQIDNMLSQIYRVTQQYVYLKQYKEYVNPYDGLRLLEDTYKLTTGWRYRYYRNDAVNSRFFETLIESIGEATPADGDVVSIRSTKLNHDRQTQREPTVSILLANFNNAEYLPTSLAAICGQTRQALEVIIVDDGSTDNSIAVIESYTQRFPGIRLIKNGRNRGQIASIQRALVEAKGDYVVWAAADDLLLPRFIERSLAALHAHPEAGLCFSRLAVFVDGTSEAREFNERTDGAAFDYGTEAHYVSPDQLQALLRRHYLWISGNTVLAKRRALLEMGGFEKSLRWHSDWFGFYVVALRYGACVIPETLALMRERRDTYSRGGMEDPVQQAAVLGAIFDKMKSPKYRDLVSIFRSRPTLMSLFGRPALFSACRNVRHWDIARGLVAWHAAHEQQVPRRLIRKLRMKAAAPVRRVKGRVRRLLGR